MIEQIETAEPRRNIVAGDSDGARKTATGHICETLAASRRISTFIISLNE